MAKLEAAQVAGALNGMPGWQGDGAEIRRQYEFKDFVQAVAFVNRVADAAESANHHPDIDIRYNRVAIGLSTHSEGGVTEKDLALARRIDALQAG